MASTRYIVASRRCTGHDRRERDEGDIRKPDAGEKTPLTVIIIAANVLQTGGGGSGYGIQDDKSS